MIPPTSTVKNNSKTKSNGETFTISRELMDKHRLFADQLAESLPRKSYRACFDQEEQEDDAARLAEMDGIKWITGLPKVLNELTSSYCSFDILSDDDVNAVLDRIERIKHIKRIPRIANLKSFCVFL